MTDRQFVIEPLNGQSVNIRSGGQIVGRLTFVSSRVTGSTAGAAASLVTWAGNGQSAVAGATVTPPAVRVLDANGLPVAGSTVTWEGNTISGATQQGLTGTSDSNGVVTLGGWSVGTTAGSASTVFAYSGNLTNSPIRFSITPTAGSAFSVHVSAGNSQSTVPVTATSRLTALVVDTYGNVKASQPLTWTTTDADVVLTESVSTTNASGLAGIGYTTGQIASVQSVFAALWASSASSARFVVTTVAGAAAVLQPITGDSQTALSGATLPLNPTLSVEDSYGNRTSSATVDFVLVAGSGNLSRSSAAPSSGGTTDVEWKLGATVGTNLLEASLRGVSGSTVTFTASGTNPNADTIQIESGNSQSGTVGMALALPLAVATLGSGSSASGQLVTFSATIGSLSTTQVVSSTSGVARTVWTLPQAVGAYTVTASAGTLAGSPLVFSGTATAGSATKLALVTQPSSQPDVGTAWPQQPVVASADQYGNLVSTNTRVQCVLVSGDGTLASGVSTFATASGATATFSGLSYTFVSVNSFQVAFRCNSLSTVTASIQTSQAPFATKLAINQQPTGGGVGLGIGSVVVAVQDLVGNTVTTATNAVNLALTPSTNTEGATLSGTSTVNAVAGVATFAGLSVDTTGSFTLDATATGLTGATTAAFSITSSLHPNAPSTSSASVVAVGPWATGITTTSPGSGGVTGVAGTTNVWRRYQATGNGGRSHTDAAAPLWPGNLLRVVHPTGQSQGVGWEHLGFGPSANWLAGAGRRYKVLYLHGAIRMADTYLGSSSGVQKLFHLWGTTAASQTAGTNYIYLAVIGSAGTTTGALRFQVRCQGTVAQGGYLSTDNMAGGNSATNKSTVIPITRGQWFEYELKLTHNTGANADGKIECWIKSGSAMSKVMDYQNFQYTGAADAGHYWTDIQLNPTYGGVGTANGDQTWDYDGPYVVGDY